MRLQLYYTPIACSMVPYINLTEARADFEVVPLNFSKGEHLDAEYVRLNPKHRVPTLMIDGTPLTENVAINCWIGRAYPRAQLLPLGLQKEMHAVSLLAWCASGIHPALTPNGRPQRFCDLPGSEESVKQCAQRLLDENFAIADAMLAGREWFFEHFTVVDAYFFWVFLRAKRFNLQYLDLSRFVHCQAHHERMLLRTSVVKLLAFEKQTQQEFAAA